MLARGPTIEAELIRLVNETCDDSRAAIDAAVREAYQLGWRAHAAAIAEFDNPLVETTPPQSAAETTPPPANSTEPAQSSASSVDSQPALVLELLGKQRVRGMTSMETIDAVHRIWPHVSAAAVRTVLHRLKINRQVYSVGGKWFLANSGPRNAGVSAPAHGNHGE
jgi:hypothetical protein